MKLLEFNFGYEHTTQIHIEKTRTGTLYFSDGYLNEFNNLKSAKNYLKNQIEYAFTNLNNEFANIKNNFNNKYIHNEDDALSVDETLKIQFLKFVDLVKFDNVNFVYNTLIKIVFPKHHEQFFEFYNYYIPDYLWEKEHILAEMFGNYKSEQLNTAVNDEMFDYDMLSNKEKAICLHVFMEMYSCHRRLSIDRNKQKNDHISIWLEDFFGKEKAEEIEYTIKKKHENEENILESWIS
tara:strand:- start:100 stop:810 length:711 start_codon:yes stop_codon:yes gene_type:complete